jgi:hypothetical protein
MKDGKTFAAPQGTKLQSHVFDVLPAIGAVSNEIFSM